jgi:hypothetical protein
MAVKLHLQATSRFTRKVKAADTTGVDGLRTGHFVIQYAYCCPESDLKYPNYVLLTANLDEERMVKHISCTLPQQYMQILTPSPDHKSR